MSAKNHPVRDPFAFSLGGVASINSHALVPAVADDNLRRIPATPASSNSGSRPKRIHEVEDFLARYFAPSCRDAI